ncbi:hypothetical protein EAH79_00660 [Sphingomonas koreensis]|nr:hypothetical protein EAH87_12695 [Sphingomonas koreensis]TPG43597.1 hypothetical protein EAH79_00660 [Sphingomonas koreensis]
MKTLPLIAAAAALSLSLAACKQKPEIVDTTAPDPMASQLANAAPIELPPAMTASVTFRCKDNSLVYVDFFKGGKLANLRTTKGGTPIQLKADAEGEPLTGDGGYAMTGDQDKIMLTQPGKGELSCSN